MGRRWGFVKLFFAKAGLSRPCFLRRGFAGRVRRGARVCVCVCVCVLVLSSKSKNKECFQ